MRGHHATCAPAALQHPLTDAHPHHPAPCPHRCLQVHAALSPQLGGSAFASLEEIVARLARAKVRVWRGLAVAAGQECGRPTPEVAARQAAPSSGNDTRLLSCP